MRGAGRVGWAVLAAGDGGQHKNQSDTDPVLQEYVDGQKQTADAETRHKGHMHERP